MEDANHSEHLPVTVQRRQRAGRQRSLLLTMVQEYISVDCCARWTAKPSYAHPQATHRTRTPRNLKFMCPVFQGMCLKGLLCAAWWNVRTLLSLTCEVGLKVGRVAWLGLANPKGRQSTNTP